MKRNQAAVKLVQQAMASKNLTTRDLATKLGKSYNYLYTIVTLRQPPSAELRKELSKLLGLPGNVFLPTKTELAEVNGTAVRNTATVTNVTAATEPVAEFTLVVKYDSAPSDEELQRITQLAGNRSGYRIERAELKRYASTKSFKS